MQLCAPSRAIRPRPAARVRSRRRWRNESPAVVSYPDTTMSALCEVVLDQPTRVPNHHDAPISTHRRFRERRRRWHTAKPHLRIAARFRHRLLIESRGGSSSLGAGRPGATRQPIAGDGAKTTRATVAPPVYAVHTVAFSFVCVLPKRLAPSPPGHCLLAAGVQRNR